jgi:hypothetical protein
MITTTARRGALWLLLAVSAACGGSDPTVPTAPTSNPFVSVPPAPPPRPTFPPLTGPFRVFAFERETAYRVSEYTKQSRFVLHDNGAFALQYVSLGGEYRGGYTESNGVITFEWEGWNTSGPWGATGTLKDGRLSVHYNEIMFGTDFEDAQYVLTP